MSLSYGWEKFHTAVLTLAGPGDIHKRLVDAYVFSIGHIKISDDIPNDLQDKVQNLCVNLTKVDPVADEGKVQATVSKLDEFEINKITEDIVSIYDSLCRYKALEDGAP